MQYFENPAFLVSNFMPPTVQPSSKSALNRDDSLTTQLSADKFRFKPQLPSLFMISTPHQCQLKPNCYKDHISR